MPVYILRHPSPDFNGVVAGVDFFNGKGSTSSIGDAYALALMKQCGVSRIEADGTETPVMVKMRQEEHLAPRFEAVAVNSSDSQAGGAGGPALPVVPPAPAPGEPAFRALKEVEDNPDSPGQIALAAKLREKKARTASRQRRHT